MRSSICDEPQKFFSSGRLVSRAVWLTGALLVGLVLGAYHNSFSVPLLLDDLGTIEKNPTIRELWPLWPVLFPPAGVFSLGRPFLNLTFALNYAFGGTSVQGYHVVNLVIHGLAGLTLFGIVRRTLGLPGLREKFGAVAHPLALLIAAVWTLHPLQTQSVTYLSQRAESLMGLCYLLTLYCFIRGSTSSAPRVMYGLALVVCLAGMATKEVMATAPVLVLLYDRTFLAGSFKAAWRQHGRFYFGLGATALLIPYLMTRFGAEIRGVGYTGGFTWWTYALTECQVVLQYLRLAFWPHPLVFDYGQEWMITEVGQVIPQALLLLLLLSITGFALRRHPALGFLGGSFFLILAPTSSIVPVVAQPMAENRMYLPLAAIVALVTIGLYAWAGRKSFVLLGIVALGFGALTVQRNQDYRSELTIWNDTLQKRPVNSRAQNNLGIFLVNTPGQLDAGIARFHEAIRLKPDYIDAHVNLAVVLARQPGRKEEAIAHYETVLRLRPSSPEVHRELAFLLSTVDGRTDDAIAHYEEALRLNPNYAEVHFALGAVLATQPGRLDEAIAHYENAIRLKASYAEAHNNLAILFSRQPGRLGDAITHYEAALRADPDYAIVHINLAEVLATLPDRATQAIVHYEAGLTLKPEQAEAQYELGMLLLSHTERLSDAIARYREAIRIKPEYVEAHYYLGIALLNSPDRRAEAISAFETAARLQPSLAAPRQMLEQLRGPRVSVP